MTNKKNFKDRKLSQKALKSKIYSLFVRNPKQRLGAKQVKSSLKVANSRDSVISALAALAEEQLILPISSMEKYKLNKEMKDRAPKGGNVLAKDEAEGKVDMTRTGSAYILCEGLEKDIHVSAKMLKGAVEGDIVRVKYKANRKGRSPDGEVIEIIKRAADHFVGTYNANDKFGFVLPDKMNLPFDIFVPLSKNKGAKDNDKVVVKIVKWATDSDKNPQGEITEVLGPAGENDMEMKSILINNGFELDFPTEVMQETEKLTDEITEDELAYRKDLRSVTTFTIDPEDAKDFDDALSVEYLENGHCQIGIHIADVAHYVRSGSALDREALKRSTSVYLVDRVLPMLPEKLSNGLCSLRPNEDKFTFSALFTFDKELKIVDRWFGKTLTHSNHRFTYEGAQEVIENKEGPFEEEMATLQKTAVALRKAKFKNGAIAFESPEVRFKLDENAVPIAAYVKQRKEAHMLVEDFMLLANREVATYMMNKGKDKEVPFVYRVHDVPVDERVQEFAEFARNMGVKILMDTPKQLAASFNKLTKDAEEKPELAILGPLAIRTMSKAAYTTVNIGHYGLAFENYSHFTSPIRRYADVLVHRILHKNLVSDKPYRVDKGDLEVKCKHISDQERKAMTAERDSVKYKQAEFLEKRIGEVYEGVIAGIIERGIFVALKENYCEGFVGFETMTESFDMPDGRYKAVGRRTGKVFKMGDSLTVSIADVDMVRKKINMRLED